MSRRVVLACALPGNSVRRETQQQHQQQHQQQQQRRRRRHATKTRSHAVRHAFGNSLCLVQDTSALLSLFHAIARLHVYGDCACVSVHACKRGVACVCLRLTALSKQNKWIHGRVTEETAVDETEASKSIIICGQQRQWHSRERKE